MTPLPRKRFTCRRTTDRNVVLQRSGRRGGWQLNTRDRAGAGLERGSFGHYIRAGGLRQLRRTHADDLAARSAARFFLILGVLGAIWLLFHFVPCG